jgi:hypothetical protein
MSTETPDVRVGDIWDDNDKRTPRRLEVVSILRGIGPPSADRVRLRNVETGKETVVARARMRPTSTGYRLTERAPTAGQIRDSAGGDR